jgi:hypothetical protein
MKKLTEQSNPLTTKPRSRRDEAAADLAAPARAAAEKLGARRPGGGEPAPPAFPKALAIPIALEDVGDAQLRTAHGLLAGSYAYDRMSVSGAVAPDSHYSAWLSTTGALYVHDFVANLAPRDAIEEAIATQLAVTNGRLMWLTVKLSEAHDAADIARLSDAVDRATNTYCRLARTWQQLRGTSPAAPAAAMVVQNNAAQQVVHVTAPQGAAASAPGVNPPPPSGKTNPSSNVGKVSDEATLPSEPQGAGGPPPDDRRQPAVGQVDRSADPDREGAVERERLQARRAERRRRPATPAGRRGPSIGGRGRPRVAGHDADDPGG